MQSTCVQSAFGRRSEHFDVLKERSMFLPHDYNNDYTQDEFISVLSI